MFDNDQIPTVHNPACEPEPGLDLDRGRVIRMILAGRTYTWSFRRIGHDAWQRFFGYFANEAMHVLGENIETFEVETGLEELARSMVASVEGYKMPETGDFRKMLPRGHLLNFGMALRDVRPTPPPADEELVLSELAEVHVDCTWTLDEASGKVEQWTGLVHRFTPPTLVQQRAYNRACNTFRVVGDDRGGKTIYPAKQRLMMDFYDELIHSVDSDYRVNGEPVIGREQIIREMDACHKVAAIQGFLNVGGSGRIVAGKKGQNA